MNKALYNYICDTYALNNEWVTDDDKVDVNRLQVWKEGAAYFVGTVGGTNTPRYILFSTIPTKEIAIQIIADCQRLLMMFV